MNARADPVLLLALMMTSGCPPKARPLATLRTDGGVSRQAGVTHPSNSPRCSSDSECPAGLECVCPESACSIRHWASAEEGEKFEYFCTTPVLEAEPAAERFP